MSVRSKPPGHRHDCTQVVADYSQQLRGAPLDSLRMTRAMVRFRLGTLAELPCDDERVQILTAEINQRLANAGSDVAPPDHSPEP